MARKNENQKVTHTQVLCWAINYQEAQRKEEADKIDRLHEVNADPVQFSGLIAELQKRVEQYDQVLAILRQMYEFETGTEYCG